MTVQEHAGNDKSCVWHTRDFADGELKDKHLCIRFASVENCRKFMETFQEVVESQKANAEKKNEENYAEIKNEENSGGFEVLRNLTESPVSLDCVWCYYPSLLTLSFLSASSLPSVAGNKMVGGIDVLADDMSINGAVEPLLEDFDVTTIMKDPLPPVVEGNGIV
ncbi:Ran binding domain [Sesbania bispinosa]|nr:Ran binding domain [Sesbania bispinosa]